MDREGDEPRRAEELDDPRAQHESDARASDAEEHEQHQHQHQQQEHDDVESHHAVEQSLEHERQQAEHEAATASLATGAAPPPSSFRTFDRTGINVVNPFQSRKREILHAQEPRSQAKGGAGSRSAAAGPLPRADRFAEREEARRREREDELYFNAKYFRPSVHKDDEDEEPRSDADYAFLRRGSELPLHALNAGQRHTARALAEDDERARGAGRGRARPASAGSAVLRSASATRASDAELLSTIDYLEGFLEKSKRDLSVRRVRGPEWMRQLDAMGGPERAGRRNAGIEREELFGEAGEEEEEEKSFARSRSPSRSRPVSARGGYAAPTVSSSPFGHHRPSPFASGSNRPRSAQSTSRSSPFGRPEQESELGRMEKEVASIRRKIEGERRERDRDISAAMQIAKERGELERSISYLEDYTHGRRPPQENDEVEDEMQGYGSPQQRSRGRSSVGASPSSSLGRSHSASRLFSPSQPSPYRIPSQHPHKTGKNHIPASCVYCARERDAGSWRSEAMKLMATVFPERIAALERGDESAGTVSRLRPLAKRMLETSASAPRIAESAISSDVDSHFLAQLSAAERRRQASRLDSLWYLVSSSERDKQAQLKRLRSEVAAEQFARSAHMKYLEERAVERCLKHTVLDKQHERDIQRLLADQARHTARLLELKKQSVANYTRDQLDLVSEAARIERDTARLRKQNDKHSLREMQRQVREANQKLKQRKMDNIRHNEEKYAFRLSELKRPAFADRGIHDFDQWKVGRS